MGWDTRLRKSSENGFDAARLVLATLVVFEHSYYLPFNSYAHEPLFVWSRGQIDFGGVAVDFFFVLSGFLITRSWILTGSPVRYLRKRIARICPGFFLASLLTIMIAAASAESIAMFLSTLDIPGTIVRILSLHQPGVSAFPDNPMKGVIDGPLWTIRFEFDCYLIVAALGTLGLLGRPAVTALFVMFGASYVLQSNGYLPFHIIDQGPLAILISNPILWPRLFTYFLAGACFYLWRDLIPKSAAVAIACALAIGLTVAFGWAELALVIAGTYLLFFVALSIVAVPRIRGRRLDLSYGIYLYGFPIQQIIIACSGQTITPIPLFAIALPVTCLVALLSWIFVERPALQWSVNRRSSLPLDRHPILTPSGNGL